MAWGAIAPQAILNIRLCSILETKVGEGYTSFLAGIIIAMVSNVEIAMRRMLSVK